MSRRFLRRPTANERNKNSKELRIRNQTVQLSSAVPDPTLVNASVYTAALPSQSMNHYVFITYDLSYRWKPRTNNFERLFLADVHLRRKTTCDRQEIFVLFFFISCVVFYYFSCCFLCFFFFFWTASSAIPPGLKSGCVHEPRP